MLLLPRLGEFGRRDRLGHGQPHLSQLPGGRPLLAHFRRRVGGRWRRSPSRPTGPRICIRAQWTALRQLWAQLDFWANCLIFVLASMLAANVLLQITWLYVWGVVAVAIGAFAGARARGVRHAAGAGEDPPRAARRQAIQGDPGVGRPARRRHDRARHGGGGRPAPARATSANSSPLFGHAVRAVHPVRQRHDARPGHARARAGQAEPPGARAARSRAGPVAGQCRASPAADHARAQRAGRRHRRRSDLGRRCGNRVAAARAGARPRRADEASAWSRSAPRNANSISSSSSSRRCRAAWWPA